MRILSKWLFGENGFVGRFRKAIDLGDHYLPKILDKECCRLTVQRSLLIVGIVSLCLQKCND